MKHYIVATIGHNKLYWQLRQQFLRLAFFLHRYIFGVRYFSDSKIEEASALNYLLRRMLFPIVGACLFVWLLFATDNYIGGLVDDIDKNIVEINWLFSERSMLESDAYTQMLNTIAAVSGVFLALYFTAVSTVAASVYSAVPHDIRELLLRDRLGNAYVRVITFLTTITILFLLATTNGLDVPILAPVIIVGLSLFSVFAFTILGLRTFYFADPTALADVVIRDFFKWVDRSSAKGWRWRDVKFQEHYRQQGYKTVAALSSLTEITAKQAHLQSDSFPKLIRKTVATIQLYQEIKYSIPTDSHWFSQKQEHKQWYLSESTDIEMATRTDNPLLPASLPDTNWVEEALLKNILDAIAEDLKERRYGHLYSKMQTLPGLLDDLGENWNISLGIHFIDDLTSLVSVAIPSVQGDTTDDARRLFGYGAVDVLASLPLSLELGFVKSLDRLNIKNIKNDINNRPMLPYSSPYRSRLPDAVIKTLEEANKSALFEMNAGANKTAPSWYVTERVLHRLSWESHKCWLELSSFVETWYPKFSKAASDMKLPSSAATVQSRALELAWKLNRHINDIEKYSKELEHGKLLDLKWPEWQWDKLKKQTKDFRDKVIDGTARSIPGLMEVERTPDLPDHLGAAVHRTGQECFEVLKNNEADRFKTLFSMYFIGVLETTDRVRPQVLGWEPNSAITWYSEPTVDLMDISGFAYVFAELHGNQNLWANCVSVWDAYLEGEGAAIRLQQLAMITQHRRRLYQISPRDTLRSGRVLELIGILRKLPRIPVESYYDSPVVRHPSIFIRKTAKGIEDLPHYPDPMDIFTAKYLMKRPDKSSLTFEVRSYELEELEEDNVQ